MEVKRKYSSLAIRLERQEAILSVLAEVEAAGLSAIKKDARIGVIPGEGANDISNAVRRLIEKKKVKVLDASEYPYTYALTSAARKELESGKTPAEIVAEQSHARGPDRKTKRRAMPRAMQPHEAPQTNNEPPATSTELTPSIEFSVGGVEFRIESGKSVLLERDDGKTVVRVL